MTRDYIIDEYGIEEIKRNPQKYGIQPQIKSQYTAHEVMKLKGEWFDELEKIRREANDNVEKAEYERDRALFENRTLHKQVKIYNDSIKQIKANVDNEVMLKTKTIREKYMLYQQSVPKLLKKNNNLLEKIRTLKDKLKSANHRIKELQAQIPKKPVELPKEIVVNQVPPNELVTGEVDYSNMD